MTPESPAESTTRLHPVKERRSGVGGVRAERASAEPPWVGIGFRIGPHLLVAATGDVGEVLRLPRVTRVPGAKGWLRGLANLRGALVAVVDLHAFLSGEFTEPTRESRVLCVRLDQATVVGLQVDKVVGLKRFQSAQRQDPHRDAPGWLRPYLSGAYRHEDELWCVFEIGRVLAAPDFQQAAT